MSVITTAKIAGYDGYKLSVIPNRGLSREIIQKQAGAVEIYLRDGRECSAEQRKKIFAIIRDISEWSGHDREYLRTYFMESFCEDTDIEYFSLSPKKFNFADMTTAAAFITYLINFCFSYSVPTIDTMLNRADDISKYLYLCIEHRKCAICNDTADIHHVDTVGMGNNRNKLIHIGMNAIALCRKHHTEAHKIGVKSFSEKYHVYGVPLDDYLCKSLRLGRREVNHEVLE